MNAKFTRRVRRQGRRLTLRIPALTAAAVLIAACSSSSTGNSSSPGGNSSTTLTVGVANDVVNWDPQTSTTLGDQQILENIYRGLTVLDPATKEPVGELAKSWTVSSDQLTWTFYLRPNAKFSNGKPVQAADVVYSIERILNPANHASAASSLTPVKSVVAAGNQTVGFHLSKPYSLLPTALQLAAWSAIIPAGSGNTIARNPVGAGPYMLASHTSQESIVLKRNPYYWNPSLPHVSTVNIKIIPDANARLEAALSGQIQLDDDVPVSNVAQAKGQSSVKVISFPSSEVDEFGMNAGSGPFADVRVRQAVAYALNKTAIAQAATFGLGGPAATMVSHASPVPVSVTGIPYDVAKAKQLLAAAGYPHGFSFSFAACGGQAFPSMLSAGQVISSQLAAVGIRAQFVNMDAGTWADEVITKDNYQAFVCGLVAGNDPDEHSFPYFSNAGLYNFSHYKAPAQLDQLLQQGREVISPAQRAQIYTQAWTILAQQVPWIPLYWIPGVVVTATSVRGYATMPELNLRLELLSVGS
jgi:peptide/nickel transport system substrate-binding protein